MIKNSLPNWKKVSIEIYSGCNRDCSFCPRYLDRSGIRKDADGKQVIKQMPSDKVFDLIDQVADLGFKGKIGFHRLSESFLDLRLFDFISYAKKKGMKYHDHTNGDMLKSNPVFCDQLDGLADTLIVGLYDYKNDIEKQNEIEFWKQRFKKTEIKFSLPLDYTKIRQNSKIYNESKKNQKILNQPCFKTGNLKIRYDGCLSFCCQDDLCNFNLGNVFESSIAEVWFSEKHTMLMNDLRNPGSRHKYDLCSNCFIPQHDNRLRTRILRKLKLKTSNY